MIKLSICIPTYNRDKYLQSNLISIFNQIDENDSVEIIVSNNCSSDNTSGVVEEFLSKPNFRYFEQNENIGPTKNFLKLVKDYSNGEFCWIVGDDDFLLPNAVKNVLTILNTNNAIDFIYAKTIGMEITEYESYAQPFNTAMLGNKKELNYQLIDKWEELLRAEYSIIFLGEVMASIFRRSIWLSYELNNIDQPAFSCLESTYPHSVIFANTFIGKKAAYLQTPAILALSGVRDWWDKLGYIILVHVKNLLALYKSKGVSDEIMADCYNKFIKLSVPFAVKFLFRTDSVKRKEINLTNYGKEMAALNAKLLFNEAFTEIRLSIRHKIMVFLVHNKRKIFGSKNRS